MIDAPTPGGEPTLPAQRAFVVQWHATADLARGRVSGRVEHVVSGRATHFGHLEDLLAFMAGLLADPAPAIPAERDGVVTADGSAWPTTQSSNQ